MFQCKSKAFSACFAGVVLYYVWRKEVVMGREEEADWGAGVKLSSNPTAATLDLAAKQADRIANEWMATASRLRVKAAALRARNT